MWGLKCTGTALTFTDIVRWRYVLPAQLLFFTLHFFIVFCFSFDLFLLLLNSYIVSLHFVQNIYFWTQTFSVQQNLWQWSIIVLHTHTHLLRPLSHDSSSVCSHWLKVLNLTEKILSFENESCKCLPSDLCVGVQNSFFSLMSQLSLSDCRPSTHPLTQFFFFISLVLVHPFARCVWASVSLQF